MRYYEIYIKTKVTGAGVFICSWERTRVYGGGGRKHGTFFFPITWCDFQWIYKENENINRVTKQNDPCSCQNLKQFHFLQFSYANIPKKYFFKILKLVPGRDLNISLKRPTNSTACFNSIYHTSDMGETSGLLTVDPNWGGLSMGFITFCLWVESRKTSSQCPFSINSLKINL